VSSSPMAGSKTEGAWSTICICSLVPPRDIFEALGVSSVTRKSKTLTGCAGTAGGGLGASGGASTITRAVLDSLSGASST